MLKPITVRMAAMQIVTVREVIGALIFGQWVRLTRAHMRVRITR